MAVVSRTSTLTFSGATGSRTWQAAAAAQDTAAGGSVTVTITQTTTGATPPSQANTLTLRYKKSDGTVIRSVTLNAASSTQTDTFVFSDTGAAAGVSRHGTVILDIQATRTDIGTYDYDTSGSPATAPTGFTATQVDRGFTRGTTTAALTSSNVAAGGIQNAPAEYNESLFVRTTLGSVSYLARALTIADTNGVIGSAATGSVTGTVRDATFANAVDDRIVANTVTLSWTVTAPNDSVTGQPYTAFSSITSDSITADSRLTAQWHFQKNTAAFDPAAFDPTFTMLASDIGQAAVRFKTARTATPQNGLSVTLTATPVNPGATVTLATTTANRAAQDGWTALVDVAPTGKPGGTWNLHADITAPANIDLDTKIVGPDQAVRVLADDPSMAVRVEAGDPASPKDHWRAGLPLTVGITMLRITGAAGAQLITRLPFDAASAVFTISSFNVTLQRLETLAADGVTWEFTDTPHVFQTAAAAGDPKLALAQFSGSQTAQWGSRGAVFVQATAANNGIFKIGGGRTDQLTDINLHSNWNILREGL